MLVHSILVTKKELRGESHLLGGKIFGAQAEV